MTHPHIATSETPFTTTAEDDDALIQLIRDLGPYDSDGEDEETDRALTERCWVTYVSLPNGDTVEIHDSGALTGSFETATGEYRRLTADTMKAILTIIDDAHFPIHRD